MSLNFSQSWSEFIYPIPNILILTTYPYQKWLLYFYPETTSAPQMVASNASNFEQIPPYVDR